SATDAPASSTTVNSGGWPPFSTASKSAISPLANAASESTASGSPQAASSRAGRMASAAVLALSVMRLAMEPGCGHVKHAPAHGRVCGAGRVSPAGMDQKIVNIQAVRAAAALGVLVSHLYAYEARYSLAPVLPADA